MLPSKPGHKLSETGLQNYTAFQTHFYKWPCTCKGARTCDRCRHPGNPANLVDDYNAWVRSESTEAFDAIKGIIGE